MKKTSNDELYDFIQKPAKHKAGRYWKYVSWIILFLFVAWLFAVIVATTIADHATTRQDAITQAQIKNGILQRSWLIVYK